MSLGVHVPAPRAMSACVLPIVFSLRLAFSVVFLRFFGGCALRVPIFHLWAVSFEVCVRGVCRLVWVLWARVCDVSVSWGCLLRRFAALRTV